MRRVFGKVPLEAAVGVEEVAEAFSFFEAAHKEDVDFSVPEFWHRGHVGGKKVQVYAVRDDGVVLGEEVLDVAEGGGGDGDAAVEALEPVLEEGAAPTVHAGATVEGVEGADVDGVGALEHCEGQVGGEGLVEVDDVELLLVEDATHPPVEPGGKGYAGDRASAWDGHTAAEGDEVLLLAVDSRGRKGGEESSQEWPMSVSW